MSEGDRLTDGWADTVGGEDGEPEGEAEGVLEGDDEGLELGELDGAVLGDALGEAEGLAEGMLLGAVLTLGDPLQPQYSIAKRTRTQKKESDTCEHSIQ